MQIDGLSVLLSPKEVSSLILSLPLPEGVQIDDVVLTDRGLEATVRAAVAFGIPIRFRVEVQSFIGSKIGIRVSPPVKPAWFHVFRPMVLTTPGAAYVGYSVIELDLVSSSKGLLSGAVIKRLALNRQGLFIELTQLTSKYAWREALNKLSNL